MATITWVQTPTIKEVTLPSGSTYYIKDDEVRQWVGDGSTSGAEKRLSDAESAITALSNATHWLGVTTTSLSDGATTNPIIVGGNSVTAVSGDIVQDSNGNEFIFNGTAWQEFGGSIGTLKAFAYVDTGTVTITPAGSNSSSAVSGTYSAPTISVKTAGETASIEGIDSVGTLPSATMPTFTVANEVLTIGASSFDAGTLPTKATAVTVKTSDAEYEASSGTISGTAVAQTFTGTEATYTVNPAT